MKRYASWACCACTVLWMTAWARAADLPITDYDKRAAATLYAAKDGKARDAGAMNREALKGLRRWEKDPAKKTAVYILEFGGVKDGIDSRGLYRIGVGDVLAPPGEGWKQLPDKPKEAGDAEVWIKPVKSDAEGFNEIGVRKPLGGITLLVRQRRPLHEPVADAVKSVAIRHAQFVELAKRYGLTIGQMRLLNMSDDANPNLADRPLPCLLSDQHETKYRVRAEVLDNDGKPLTNVKKMSFKLRGRLAGMAKVTAGGKPVATPTQKFDVEDPKESVELTITFPKTDAKAQEKVFGEFAAAQKAGEAPLEILYSATFK
jgi:hypothetical protein